MMFGSQKSADKQINKLKVCGILLFQSRILHWPINGSLISVLQQYLHVVDLDAIRYSYDRRTALSHALSITPLLLVDY
jgi:hypothetical protein